MKSKATGQAFSKGALGFRPRSGLEGSYDLCWVEQFRSEVLQHPCDTKPNPKPSKPFSNPSQVKACFDLEDVPKIAVTDVEARFWGGGLGFIVTDGSGFTICAWFKVSCVFRSPPPKLDLAFCLGSVTRTGALRLSLFEGLGC